MANTLFPSSTDDQSYSQAAHSILNEMILCGNRVAEVRKDELVRIESLFSELAKRVEQEGLRTLTLSGREVADTTALVPRSYSDEGETSLTEPAEAIVRDVNTNAQRGLSAEPSDQGIGDSLDLVGISSCEFLSIVDQIDNPGIPYGIFEAGSEWLAGENLPESFA